MLLTSPVIRLYTQSIETRMKRTETSICVDYFIDIGYEIVLTTDDSGIIS